MASEHSEESNDIRLELAFGLCTAMALLAIVVFIGTELLEAGA